MREKIMKKFLCTALCVLFYLAMPLTASAQDGSNAGVDKDAASQERRARLEELRPAGREQRRAQRQDIQRRLENLSDDERAALREKRRINSRQGQRPRRGNKAARGSNASIERLQSHDAAYTDNI
jgi:flagellar motility protein MotE (MotC chaperone)